MRENFKSFALAAAALAIGVWMGVNYRGAFLFPNAGPMFLAGLFMLYSLHEGSWRKGLPQWLGRLVTSGSTLAGIMLGDMLYTDAVRIEWLAMSVVFLALPIRQLVGIVTSAIVAWEPWNLRVRRA